MRAILERLEGGAALRTDTVEGNSETPTVGRSFRMLGAALFPETGAWGRLVETSPVTSVVETWHPEDGPGFLFTTQSGSHYRLTVLS